MSEIIGYTYKAENYTPAGIIHVLVTEGRLSPGAWGMAAEDALFQLGEYDGINRDDETSFDSDHFPKVIFSTDDVDPDTFTDAPAPR